MNKLYQQPAISILFIITALAFFVRCGDKEIFDNESIAESEKLIGVSFTETERDSMIELLSEYRIMYDTLRAVSLPNSIPPAINFNPVPIGKTFSKVQKPLTFDDYSQTLMPDNMDDLAYYSIGELAHLIKTKQITSVRLSKFYLDRLKKFGPKIESVISLTEALAMEQANRADQEISSGNYKGLLHGIPYGAKDLLAVSGYKTTWGAEPYKDKIINEDAEVIMRLENAGAVLCAKLTMGALAWGDVWFGGRTRNPWDTEKGSSGSSAGSAASVSAGLLPFAIGTETWGSIVSPSTVTGVSGLRPTYGRVSRTGAMALSWTMDKIGPICRNAEDLAIVFNAIYGTDGIDQTLVDLPFNYDHEIDFSKMKIGYVQSDFDEEYDFHKNDSLTLETLRNLGAELIPVELPKIPSYEISFILNAEAAAAFDELTRSNKDDLLVRQNSNAWPNVFRASRFIPAVEYINANRARYLLIQKMEELMEKVDFYIAPSWQGNNLILTNLTGHPCVVVPNGFNEGVPTSITFIGDLYDEGTIISAAHKFQTATEYHLQRPKDFLK